MQRLAVGRLDKYEVGRTIAQRVAAVMRGYLDSARRDVASEQSVGTLAAGQRAAGVGPACRKKTAAVFDEQRDARRAIDEVRR